MGIFKSVNKLHLNRVLLSLRGSETTLDDLSQDIRSNPLVKTWRAAILRENKSGSVDLSLKLKKAAMTKLNVSTVHHRPLCSSVFNKHS